MIIERPSLFCDLALAGRVERSEAELVAAASAAARRRRGDQQGFVIPVAGGVASFAEPDSPFNKVAGLGFGGIPGPAELGELERAFAGHDAPVQVELSHLAAPEIASQLTGRGYRLVAYENVLGRTLADAAEPGAAPPGVEVQLSPVGELETWLDVVLEAELEPDTEGLPSEEFPRAALENAERDLVAAPGTRRYLARRDGIAAGGASFRTAASNGGSIAQFTGAATLPAHRRRGVQTALLAARLADAAAAGCDLAVITTSPGTKSQRNAQRQGFDLLYTRAILIKG
jgi:GNAT superfamily N-acetyltransferase